MAVLTWCDATIKRPPKDPDSDLPRWEIDVATFSYYTCNQLLQFFDNDKAGGTITIPTELYIGIHTTPCNRLNAGTELTISGYERTRVRFERLSDIQRANLADYYSPNAATDWAGIESFSLYDALTGGNYIAFGNLLVPYTLPTGKRIVWEQGTVTVDLGSFPIP